MKKLANFLFINTLVVGMKKPVNTSAAAISSSL
jgi:hypothetical protein